MRILLLTGGLYLLAAMPVAAQEASDSTRILAMPAGTPAAPSLQQLFVGVLNALSNAVSAPGIVGIAGAALVALGLCLMLRSAGQGSAGMFRTV